MLVHWIWLATRPELRDRDKAVLLQRFSDPEEIFFAEPAAFSDMELSREQIQSLLDKDIREAEAVLRQCRDKRIHVLTMQDASYPSRLKNITDPPVVLYYKGNLPDLDGVPVVGVVGTRSASVYGLNTAKQLGYEIGLCGGIVVSGIAGGIDGLAMRGALGSGMPVIGILGCGVDVIYPRSNRDLFADTENHGCLISEFTPGTPPYKWNFPKRNRIISGMCDGVLVVEAPKKSGALITARQAADQGRDVFVVPGNLGVASCEGSNQLLRDGAIPVTCGWDLMSEYEHRYPGKIRRADANYQLRVYPDEVAKSLDATAEKVAQRTMLPKKVIKSSKKTIDKEELPPYSDGNDIHPQLTESEQGLLDLLGEEERLVDDLIAASGLHAGLVLATLTMLEVKGVVRSLPGRRVARKQ